MGYKLTLNVTTRTTDLQSSHCQWAGMGSLFCTIYKLNGLDQEFSMRYVRTTVIGITERLDATLKEWLHHHGNMECVVLIFPIQTISKKTSIEEEKFFWERIQEPQGVNKM